VPNRTRGSRVKLREGQQKDAIFEGKIMEWIRQRNETEQSKWNYARYDTVYIGKTQQRFGEICCHLFWVLYRKQERWCKWCSVMSRVTDGASKRVKSGVWWCPKMEWCDRDSSPIGWLLLPPFFRVTIYPRATCFAWTAMKL
jgi:hypothetical protein